MPKPGRIPCCVPFCGRTAAADKHPGCSDIICGKHWRLAPKVSRRVYTRAYKRYEIAHARGTAIENGYRRFTSNADYLEFYRSIEAVQRLWSRMKAIIISLAY